MADSPAGEERTLRLRFIGDFSDPNQQLDRLEQRGRRGITMSPSGGPGGTVGTDPTGTIQTDTGAGLGGPGGVAGMDPAQSRALEGIERARQRERRAAERAADAEERRARVLEGALSRYQRPGGAQAGTFVVTPGARAGVGPGLPVAFGGGGGPQGAGGVQIQPGTPSGLQWYVPPSGGPQIVPGVPAAPGGGGWADSFSRMGRLGRLATTGFLVQEALNVVQAGTDYANAQTMAGRDQRAQYQATTAYIGSISRIPFVGQAAAMLADPGGHERLAMENTLRSAEATDEVTDLQRRAEIDRANLRREAYAMGFTGTRRSLELAQNQYDAGIIASRARQTEINAAQEKVFESQRVEAQEEFKFRIGNYDENDQRNPVVAFQRQRLNDRLKAIEDQKSQFTKAGESRVTQENESKRLIMEAEKADLIFNQQQAIAGYRSEGQYFRDIREDRGGGSDTFGARMRRYDRDTFRQSAKIRRELGDEAAGAFEGERQGEKDEESLQHERDVNIKLTGLRAQAAASRYTAGRDTLMATLSQQWAQFGIGQVRTRDEGSEMQRAQGQADMGRIAATLADAARSLAQFTRANTGQIAVNALLMGGDTRAAGIRQLENQRDKELDEAGGGIMGFFKRLSIRGRSASDVSLFKRNYDLNDQFRVKGEEQNIERLQMRAEGKEKSATAKDIEDKASLEAQQIMARASTLDKGSEGYKRAQRDARLALRRGIAEEEVYQHELQLQQMGAPISLAGFAKGGFGAGNINAPQGQERVVDALKNVGQDIKDLKTQLLGIN
jgi:hypothetical protein